MILLVGLANIIMLRAQENEVTTVPETSPEVAERAKPGGGPLADAGVIPDVSAESKPAPAPDPAEAIQSLPDVGDVPAVEP